MMNKKILILAVIIVAISLFIQPVYSAINQMQTNVDDRQAVNITVYNNNLALVNDIREITIPLGSISLNFVDIAKKIDPSSIHVSFPSNHGTISLSEQNFSSDIISPKTLLNRYIGRDIKLAEKNSITGQESIINARLLSNDPKPIFLIDNEIHIDHPGRIILPAIPNDLSLEPRLSFLLDCQSESPYSLEVSYLTGGLNWDAYYTLLLNQDESRGDLIGWVNITNDSGMSYEDTHIKLIAGDIHRIQESRPGIRRKTSRPMMAEDTSQFREEEFFDYHVYTLPRIISLKNNQSKKIQLLNANRIPLKKEYRYYSGKYYAGRRYNDKPSGALEYVGIYFEMENKIANNLGMPLPGGTSRIYKKDNEGITQLLGEDTINHIPVNEKVEIEIGKAFDITINRSQTDWKKIAKNQFEAAWEINVSNQKSEAVSIKVFEPVPGTWEIMNSNHDWTKVNSHMIVFTIIIPPRMTEKISYKVSVRY